MVTGKENQNLRLMRPNGSFKRELADDSTTLPSDTTATLPSEPSNTATAEPSNTTTAEPSNTTTAEPSNTTTPEAQPMGQGIATVRDTTGQLELYPSNNGNLFVAPVGSTEDLAVLTNSTTLLAITMPDNEDIPYAVAGDSADRLLHYFPEEASTLGTSRLRLATWDKLPVGSRLINLVPVASDTSDDSMLVGVDSQGDYLFPVMCAIENQNNKIFLVKDTSASALLALEADDLRFVLTGGAASKCGPLALLATISDVTTSS